MLHTKDNGLTEKKNVSRKSTSFTGKTNVSRERTCFTGKTNVSRERLTFHGKAILFTERSLITRKYLSSVGKNTLFAVTNLFPGISNCFDVYPYVSRY